MDIELINKYLKSQPFEVKSFLLTLGGENSEKLIANKINFHAPWGEQFWF